MDKTFIYVEGRDGISAFMENDVERATKVWGWTYKNIREIQPDCFLNDDEMGRSFPSCAGVFMRNLPKNTEADYASLASWLNKNKRVTINILTESFRPGTVNVGRVVPVLVGLLLLFIDIGELRALHFDLL